MIICLSTNVQLNADNGLLFGMRFFCYSTSMKKSLNPKFYFYFFSSSDIRNKFKKSVKEKIKKLWPNELLKALEFIVTKPGRLSI